MHSRIKRHLTYANVVSSIALFAVLGGAAYAGIDRRIKATDLAKNAVTTPKIKGKAVKAGKLAANSVRTPKIQDGAVTKAKLADGTAGSALAYAQVLAFSAVPDTPELASARTSGFVGVSRPSTGLYCLQPSAAVVNQAFSGGQATRPPVASVEWGNTTTNVHEVIVQPRGSTVECPANRYEIRTYRNGALASNVGFILIVP